MIERTLDAMLFWLPLLMTLAGIVLLALLCLKAPLDERNRFDDRP